MGDEAYRKARARLFDEQARPTRQYQAYLRFQEIHQELVRLRDEARSAAMTEPMSRQNWPIRAREFDDAVDGALNRWLALGFKRELDDAVDVVRRHRTRRTAD
jgi:hypothetical protein